MVELWHIGERDSSNRINIGGYDQDRNRYATWHDYNTGKVLSETYLPSERLKKIYMRKKRGKNQFSIIGETKAGVFYHITHRYDDGNILETRVF